MSAQNRQKTLDHFLELPTELRYMIYDELFVTLGLISVDAPEKHLLAILSTSKRHNEAAHTFYSKNEFLFTRPSIKPFAPIPTNCLGHLKSIAISICTGHPDLPTMLDKAALIRAPACANLKLDHVSIDIRSDLHPMTVDRFDDGLLGRLHPITHALSYLIRSGAATNIRIRLTSARFGTDIAIALCKVFKSAASKKNTLDATLTFFIGDSYDVDNVVTDPSQCERGATGIYTTAPMTLGDFSDDALTFGLLEHLGVGLNDSFGYDSSARSNGRSVADRGRGLGAESSNSHAVGSTDDVNECKEHNYDTNMQYGYQEGRGEDEDDYDDNEDDEMHMDDAFDAVMAATIAFAPQLL